MQGNGFHGYTSSEEEEEEAQQGDGEIQKQAHDDVADLQRIQVKADSAGLSFPPLPIAHDASTAASVDNRRRKKPRVPLPLLEEIAADADTSSDEQGLDSLEEPPPEQVQVQVQEEKHQIELTSLAYQKGSKKKLRIMEDEEEQVVRDAVGTIKGSAIGEKPGEFQFGKTHRAIAEEKDQSTRLVREEEVLHKMKQGEDLSDLVPQIDMDDIQRQAQLHQRDITSNASQVLMGATGSRNQIKRLASIAMKLKESKQG